MPGKTIQLGPFKGGLNTHSDNSSIADNELVVCENFENDFDGSLVSRPPFQDTLISMPLGATGDIHLLGYFIAPGNISYLIGSDGLHSTYYYTGSLWVLITNTFAASDFAQFNNRAWLLAPIGSPAPGGYWSPPTGFVSDINMPFGETIVANKSRLWIAQGKAALTNNTFVYFSEVLGTIPFWKVAPNFIDVGSGDGQNIVRLFSHFGSILIFRDNSIYLFTYSIDPTFGAINILVPNIGLTDRYCVVSYQRTLFFMHNEKLYQFDNNQATLINQRVPFTAGTQAGIYLPYSVSLFNQRIMVSFWDKLYVFSLLTRTWSTWKSDVYGPIGRFVRLPPADGPEQAIIHSSLTVPGTTGRRGKTLIITDAVTSAAEAMTCTARTKNYDYQAPSVNKRLFSGGIDAIFRGQLTARAIPIFFTKKLTWGQVRAQYTWHELLQKTWGTLSSDTRIIENIVTSAGSSAQRKYVKLFKSLFFRQIGFEAVFQTDGSFSTAPVRLFSFMTYVLAKENVSKPTS